MSTNTFKMKPVKNITTSPSTIHTGASSTQTIVVGAVISNTTAGAITVDLYITRSAVDYYLVKSAPIPVGGSLIFGGGDMKIVLETNDALKVVSNTVTSADGSISILEIT